jgi:hypothetical protein
VAAGLRPTDARPAPGACVFAEVVMSEQAFVPVSPWPRTEAVRRVVADSRDQALVADLLFLERWEMAPVHGPAAARRVTQIRRANPALAAEVRAEIAGGRG